MTVEPEPTLVTNVALAAVKNIRNQLLSYGIVETALMGGLLVVGADVPSGLTPVVYAIAALILLVALGHFFVEYRTLVNQSPGVAAEETGRRRGMETYPASDSMEFRDLAERLILAAQDIVLIGTGLNLLHRDTFARQVIMRAARGDCRLELYLADPASPRVRTRLAEEELSNYKPPVGRKGLEDRLATVLAQWRSLGRPDSIKIRLFTNYPTMAILLIDGDYFVYPYGFATLGNFSPVLHVSKDDRDNAGFVRFLEQQYRLIKENSVDADVVAIHRHVKHRRRDHLASFALYYVPPAESMLYKLGTRILGYDVREQQMGRSRCADAVGSAAKFGFHLTLADALYFFTEAEMRAVVADLQVCFKDFSPFNIGDFRICEHFPDAQSVALCFDDHSGNLEALNHELVHRAYAVAAGSDYSLGYATLTRDTESHRAATIIRHYQAPYILSRYQPHFTLASNLESERQAAFRAEVENLTEFKHLESTIQVDRLAVMSKDPVHDRWIIADELPLR